MKKHANQEQIGGQSVQGKKCWCWTLLVNRFGFPLALATVEKYILKNREEILNTIKSSPYDERQQQSSGAGQPSPFYICILTFSIIFLLIFLPPFQLCCLFFCHHFGCFFCLFFCHPFVCFFAYFSATLSIVLLIFLSPFWLFC